MKSIQLKQSRPKDRAAIRAIKEVSKVLNYDNVKTLRFICEASKDHAIQKAQEIKKIKAS